MIMRDRITSKERLEPSGYSLSKLIEDIYAGVGLLTIFYIFLIVVTN